jgi:DNA-directed RNA polymerase subunit RPC12/RpoP
VIEISNYDEHLETHKEKSKPQINNVKPHSYVPVTKLQDEPKLIKQQSERRDCQYCNLQLPMEEFYDHVSICGARSTKCEYCSNTVLIKQLEKHYELCDVLLMNQVQEDFLDGISFLK